MSHHVRKELHRLQELVQHNPNTAPIKRQIETLEARLEVSKSEKKAKKHAKNAASGLTGREARLQKVEIAEQAAAKMLADATEQAERSLQEHTHLQEKGASEVELAALWTKVVDHQEQQRIATIKFHEAEQKTIHTREALQKSLANASSAPSNPSPTNNPSGFPPHSGPQTSVNSGNFAVQMGSDVMERPAGDEGLSAFEEK